MWISNLRKHFNTTSWKKYYKKIIFYMKCINFGLKPSFLWDFGPKSVHPEHLSNFLKDLKESCLICEDIIVINIDDINFVANIYYLLESLERNHLFMDITKREEEWVLVKNNKFLVNVIERLKLVEKCSTKDVFALQLIKGDCLPSIFGLMLGYPLIYYFNLSYPNFPLRLLLYKAACKFEFLNTWHESQIYSFTIPVTLFNSDVENIVNKWFQGLRSISPVIFQDLKIECSYEYVNSLNL